MNKSQALEYLNQSPEHMVSAAILKVAFDAWSAMDDELTAAKNKAGVLQKFAHRISPNGWAAFRGSPKVGEQDPMIQRTLLIELDMCEKLTCFAKSNGLEMPVV